MNKERKISFIQSSRHSSANRKLNHNHNTNNNGDSFNEKVNYVKNKTKSNIRLLFDNNIMKYNSTVNNDNYNTEYDNDDNDNGNKYSIDNKQIEIKRKEVEDLLSQKIESNTFKSCLFEDYDYQDINIPKINRILWNNITISNISSNSSSSASISSPDSSIDYPNITLQQFNKNSFKNIDNLPIKPTYTSPMHPSSPRLGLVSVLHDQPAFASSLLLSIDSTTKSKYFGIESKQAFYSTYQEIIKQSKQVVGGLDTVESSLELDDPSRSIFNKSINSYMNNDSRLDSRLDSINSRLDNRLDSRLGSQLGSKRHSHIIIQSSNKITQTASKKDHIDDDSSIASWGIPLDNQLDNDVNDNLQTLSLDIDKDLSFDGSDINTVSSYAPHSPRATYIIGLLRSHLPPRASILLRNKFTTELNLAHLGIGDQLAIILAKALPSLPCLEIANFKNNNLTDSGLEAIINSIAGHENLVELDISSNKIDDNAAAALGSYIGRRNCPLRSLKLSDADIEDSECNQFVEHLMLNVRLYELDLSKNILGKDENLKAVNPSIITGGVSLANLLRENFCPIKKLNVHWNMIRMEGAAELCDSIRQTKSLMYLDLSYNSIGREGASILGSALLDNKSLVDLILSNNSIDAVGCFTLIVGAREHNSLAFIDLDGNPIGDQGGRILMKLARFYGHRIRFSAQKCDVIVKSDDIILEINEPIGKYQLNLSNPYDRAVASELLDLVASDPTLEFSKFEFSDSKDFNKRSTSLSLIKCRETILQLSSENQAEVDRLTKIVNIASDSEKIEEVFDIFDKDKSGQLDPIEFQRMLYMLGFDSSEEKVTAIMTTLDADGDCINLDECGEYIHNVNKTAQAHIKELTTYPCYKLSSSNDRYIPSNSGYLLIEVNEILEGCNPEDRSCLTKYQCIHIIEAAVRTMNPSLMIKYAIENAMLYLDESQILFNYLISYEDTKVLVLSDLIPHMATTIDAFSLVKLYIGSEGKSKFHFKKAMGMSYNPLLGMYNGYYVLDLSKPTDRQCLHKLFEESIQINNHRKNIGKWDISQNGNWSCFRNVIVDGKPVHTLLLHDYSPIPKAGKLEFDFVDYSRPNHEIEKPLNDYKFILILISSAIFGLNNDKQQIQQLLYNKLNTLRSYLKYYSNYFPNSSDSQSNYVNNDYNRVSNIFECVNKINSRIYSDRKTSYEKSYKKEITIEKVKDNKIDGKTDMKSNSKSNSKMTSRRNSKVETNIDVQILLQPDKPVDSIKLIVPDSKIENKSNMKIDIHGDDILNPITSPIGRNNPKNKNKSFNNSSNYDKKNKRNSQRSPSLLPPILTPLLTLTTKYKSNNYSMKFLHEKNNNVLINKLYTLEYKANHLLDYFIDSLINRWISCIQLSVLLELFKLGSVSKTFVGSYRVELIVSLFSRIVDLHNFNFLLSVLTAEEVACIYIRIGWLCLFNPMRPEGVYRLDLSRWEERQVAKMLIHLSVVEPGINWYDESYTSSHQGKPMPGWTLTKVWYTENGMPKQGILQLRMSSGEGMYQNRCIPDITLRQQLLLLTLVDITDIKLDLEYLYDPKISQSKAFNFSHSSTNNNERIEKLDKKTDRKSFRYDLLSPISSSKSISKMDKDINPIVKKQLDVYIYKNNSLNDLMNQLNTNTDIQWSYLSTFLPESWKKM